MIVVVMILCGVYYIVYRESQPAVPGKTPRFLTLMASGILAVSVFVYAYIKSNDPPFINYWKIGWSGYMQALNIELEKKGSKNRMHIPGP